MTTAKFKKGDRVVYTGKSYNIARHDYTAGDELVISGVFDYAIACSDERMDAHFGNTSGVWFPIDDLEHSTVYNTPLYQALR